jgi:hypothetical protein
MVFNTAKQARYRQRTRVGNPQYGTKTTRRAASKTSAIAPVQRLPDPAQINGMQTHRKRERSTCGKAARRALERY